MRTALPTAPFAPTCTYLTRAGLGAWAIGGGGWWFAWREQDEADSVAAIRHAVESGRELGRHRRRVWPTTRFGSPM